MCTPAAESGVVYSLLGIFCRVWNSCLRWCRHFWVPDINDEGSPLLQAKFSLKFFWSRGKGEDIRKMRGLLIFAPGEGVDAFADGFHGRVFAFTGE